MDHLCIHHLQEYNAVVVVISKKISLTVFFTQRQVSRVCVMFQGNGPAQEIGNEAPRATHTTDGEGVVLNEESVARRNAVSVFF